MNSPKSMKFSFLPSMLAGLFVSANFFAIFLYFKNVSTGSQNSFNLIDAYTQSLLFFFTIGFVVAAFFGILIGWPLLFFTKKLIKPNYFTSAASGGLIVMMPLLAAYLFGWHLPNIWSIEGILLVCSILICGACGGLAFHFLEFMQTT